MIVLVWVSLLAYPLLQAYTLRRSRGWMRAMSLLILALAGPFYLWSYWKIFTPQPDGDLSGLLIVFMAPWPVIILTLLAVGCAGAARDAAPAGEAAAPADEEPGSPA